jgi:hypothetical protein
VASGLYYLGLSLLAAHEMDAVRHAEWRLLYVLRDLGDAAAYPVFVALHVPLFYLFFWLSHHDNRKLRGRFRGLVALFLIVHAALHFRLSDAAAYDFEGVLANTLIYGAAACGLGYLLASRTAARGNPA